MYLTEQELKGQFQAVARTLEALHAKRAEAVAALAGVQTLCALGCGSSFSLAKSAAIQFSQHTGVPAYALAAGDLLVNFPAYEKMLRGTTLLLLSRSGSTISAGMLRGFDRDFAVRFSIPPPGGQKTVVG